MVPPSDHLQERDIGVLADVAEMRYLTSAQVARLRFSHPKLAQRRLRILWQRGLVHRFRLASGPALGDHRWIYRIAPSGTSLVASRSGCDRRQIVPPVRVPASVGYFEHHEQLTDTRIWFREACDGSKGDFSHELVPAYEETRVNGRRRKKVGVRVRGQKGLLIPDAVTALRHRSGRADVLLVEIDRGTQPLRRKAGCSVQHKLRLFAAAYDDGLKAYDRLLSYQFPGARMLWVVPDEKRSEAVVRLAQQLRLEPLVWVTTRAEILAPGGLDTPVWSVAGRPGRHSLVGGPP